MRAAAFGDDNVRGRGPGSPAEQGMNEFFAFSLRSAAADGFEAGARENAEIFQVQR